MNIGVIGYYGFGNVGDKFILENLHNFLVPHRVIAFPIGFVPNREAIGRLNAFDFLILGGGGLFNRIVPSPFNTFDQWMDCLKPPIGVLGLGVERLDSAYVGAIHRLVDKSRFFVLRDEESKRLVGHLKAQVAPDLTFYKPFQIAAASKTEEQVVCGVNLRPVRPGVSEWISAVRALPGLKRAIPFSIHPDFDDREPLVRIDPACPAAFEAAAYSSLDLIVGTAFHSVVFAIQSGIPAVAIDYHCKVRRLMEDAGLSEYILEWDEWGKLPICYEEALMNQDAIRRRMLEYTAEAKADLLGVLQDVRHEIDLAEKQSRFASVEVPVEPKVSIVVIGQDAAEGDLAKTISSCLEQTHRNLEVILVANSDQIDLAANGFDDDARVRTARPEQEIVDCVESVLSSVAGEYVTWLRAGTSYVADAISVLVNNLEKRPVAGIALADSFITNAGIIERNVQTGKEHALNRIDPIGSCFLVRRERVRGFWEGKVEAGDSGGKGLGFGDIRIVHIPLSLMSRPATESEICLYRSAIAYGRGRLQYAKQLLSDALSSNPRLLGSDSAEVVALLERAAHNTLITRDPDEFVRIVFQNLPEGADELNGLEKKVLSRIAMARFFEAYQMQDWRTVRRTVLYGLWNDTSWLWNRGVITISLESLLGTRVTQRVRALYHQLFSRPAIS